MTSLNRTARFQLGATFVAAVLLPLIVGSFSLILIAASVLCSYVAIRQGYSSGLTHDPNSWSNCLFVLFVLCVIGGVPFTGWLFIVGLHSLIGLTTGPAVMQLFK
jgi:hypothetical protein